MLKTDILNHKSKKYIALVPLFLILVSCGGGGGSSGQSVTVGSAGGSGIVILRYKYQN